MGMPMYLNRYLLLLIVFNNVHPLVVGPVRCWQGLRIIERDRGLTSSADLLRIWSTSGITESSRPSRAAQEDGEELRDENEWQIVLKALKKYKEEYGNMRVPTRFRVPNDDASWPEDTHDLRLGNKVAAIRSAGKYVSRDDSRREILDSLGFEWRLRRLRQIDTPDTNDIESFDLFLSALETYVELHGRKSVHKLFVVPRLDPWPADIRGLPLGASIELLKNANIRLGQSAPSTPPGNMHPYFDTSLLGSDTVHKRIQRLEQLGLKLKHFQARLVDYDAVNDKTEISGDKQDDKTSVAVDDEATENYLAEIATMTKQRKRRMSSDEAFQVIIASLQAYRRIVGPGKVPQTFVIPDGEPWPVHVRGVTLGLRLSKIRLNGSYVRDRPDRRQKLLELGVELPEEKKATWEEHSAEPLAERLSVADADDDDDDDDDDVSEMRSPSSRLVPLTLDLDDDVTITSDQINKCRTDGWDFDDFEGDFDFDDVLRALTEFERRYGDFDIPENFIVGQAYPEDDEEETNDQSEESDETDEEELDAALAALLAGSSDEGREEPSIEELLALEAETDTAGEFFDDDLRRLLSDDDDDDDDIDDEENEKSNDSMNSSDLMIHEAKKKHREPLISEPWPAELHGLKLGFITEALRVGDIFAYEEPKRRAALDRIGFDWGDREIYIRGLQWHHFLACLFSYSKIKGSLSIAWDFVIPDEDPWPLPLRGEHLGTKVNLIREQESVLRTHFKHRAQLLDAMGFVFLPPMFSPPPEKRDTRLPPCLRLNSEELELTRQDRRRKSTKKAQNTGDFIPYVFTIFSNHM
uniref:Helicase-associated domain-containing protein n=1 Tax=Aureoumbra lagunensis TaxID=44058 RepID=A0A7S3JWY5_9STRA